MPARYLMDPYKDYSDIGQCVNFGPPGHMVLCRLRCSNVFKIKAKLYKFSILQIHQMMIWRMLL